MLTGSCLCGAIAYEVDAIVGPFVYCHCRMCRKASGSAFGANGAVRRERFRLLRGAATLANYESSPGVRRYFCQQCGSPLYKAVATAPEMFRLRLGTLDTPFTERSSGHIFVASQAPWFERTDSKPAFDAFPDPATLTLHGSRQSSDAD